MSFLLRAAAVLFALVPSIAASGLAAAEPLPAQSWSQSLRFGDGSYFMQIYIAGPYPYDGQYMIDYWSIADTGSSNLLLIGDKCDSCAPSSFWGDTRYQPSPSAQPGKVQFMVSYDEDSGHAVKALEYGDQFFPGGHGGSMSVPFGVILNDTEGSGHKLSNIVGLGYPANADPSEAPIEPYLDAVLGKTGKPAIFALRLCGEDGTDSLIDLGGVRSQPDQTFAVQKDTNNTYREFAIAGSLWYGSRRFGDSSVDGGSIIIDSGTTEIELPAEAMGRFGDHVNELLGEIDFERVDVGNTFEWHIRNASIYQLRDALQPMRLCRAGTGNEGCIEINPEAYFEIDSVGDQAFTVSVRVERGDDDDVILGQAFMESFYSIFDRKSTPNQIGFAGNGCAK